MRNLNIIVGNCLTKSEINLIFELFLFEPKTPTKKTHIKPKTKNIRNPISQSPLSAGRSSSPLSTGSCSAHFISSPKNSVNPSTSPLSSPPHQQQSDLSSTNTNSTFQLTRKANFTPGTTIDTGNNQNQINQPVAQTTTLNLHGINFSSLQGAMATFPGLQNVQVSEAIFFRKYTSIHCSNS